MDKVEIQRQHFENISSTYFESRQTENHLRLKELMWGYFFKDKDFLKRENMLVLEPMCGYSEGKKILEKHLNVNFSYEGFDYSDTLVNTVKRLSPEINIKKADVTKFKSEIKYDLIILIGGLHHVPDFTGRVLDNLFDSLKDGGYFISLEPTQNNLLFKIIRDLIYKRNKIFDSQTEKAFDLKDINRLFQQSHFTIKDQIYPGLLSYIFYYNPDAFPFLNIRSKFLVNKLFAFDKLFFKNIVGRKISFATLTLLKKQ